MKKLLSTAFLALSLSLLSMNAYSITDNDIKEITERLEGYSSDQLIERREILLANLDMKQEDDLDETSSEEDSEAADESVEEEEESNKLEISIIDAMLAALGIVMLDNVMDDDSDSSEPEPPVDTTPPVITVLGDNPATVELGDTYVDAGATADGGETVSASGTVDVFVVGSYTITYSATDDAGNEGTATRTVNVVDTTAPVITINGDNPVTVELGDTYEDAGASATDASQTHTLETTGSVDTSTAGTYTITYTASDASGNTATDTRTVNVVDTVAPVFTSASTFTIDENQNVIGTISATDLGGVTLFTGDGGSRYEFTGGVDNTSSPATLILAPSAVTDGYSDYETIQSFGCSTGYEPNMYTLKARDPSGNETVQNVCIQLNNLNDNTPNITSDASFSAVENQTAIGTVTAEDADGDLNDLVFSVTGDNIAIDSASGALTFVTAPDFETQSAYTATVTVTDGTNSASQDISIAVTNDESDDSDDSGTATGTHAFLL